MSKMSGDDFVLCNSAFLSGLDCHRGSTPLASTFFRWLRSRINGSNALRDRADYNLGFLRNFTAASVRD
jgi:hypothetical protein